uniref:Uncharacterized protein n=1 Tax=Strigamia maritima TaxID=126957 RepID=T1JKU1_STRMM
MVQIRTLVTSKEYSEFKNLVILLENSFAEINKNGTGIQQVRLAISPEFLLTASYVSLDPNCTTLELVNVIPLDFLAISVQSNRHRIIRLCYCTGINRYYELSERNNSSSVWRNWCDRIHFLNGQILTTAVSDLSINSKIDLASENDTLNPKHMSDADNIDEDPIKDVIHMLDLSESYSSKDEIGVIVNKSVFELVKSFSQSDGKCGKNDGKRDEKNVHCVPRFASGVSEKCENQLMLGQAIGGRSKKRISSIKSDETVLCSNDTVVMSDVKECVSDVSIYFSTRESIELVEKNVVDEESGEKTARLHIVYFIMKMN